ncbi:hypothetical protein A2U01_0062340, partial [Trifolium medium]|nr:hypothetical protein [Trifolium medium]
EYIPPMPKALQKLNTCNPPSQEDPRTHLRERQGSVTKKERYKRPPINQTSQRSNSTPQQTLPIPAKNNVRH